MANLSNIDKKVLEKFLGMDSGYVLDFSDRTFRQFFLDNVGIDIEQKKYYADHSGSKANRMRTFWSLESDQVVGKLLKAMLEDWKATKELEEDDIGDKEKRLYEKCLNIVSRLLGKKVKSERITEKEFLRQEFREISLDKLNLDKALTKILEQRLKEIDVCLNSGAALAVVFLCGSTLEGILSGVAENNLEKFKSAKASPKGRDKQVKSIEKWRLYDLIDVAREIGFLNEDVERLGHALRDFRNYIHPREQAARKPTINKGTAKLCYQALEIAISQLIEKQV